MSGSSFDGLDIALCEFKFDKTFKQIGFEIKESTIVPFTGENLKYKEEIEKMII